jgi:dCTP diphosphatase
LTEIRDASRAFIADREWQQFQDPKSILLALVGEVGDSRAAEEMADVLVYLVGLADQCGVDLVSAALAKIKTSAVKYPPDQNRGVAPDKT